MRCSPSALLGPLRCAACGLRRGPLCVSCARSLAPPAEPAEVTGAARALAAFRYEGAARSLVLALKVRGTRGYAAPLSAGMVEVARRAGVAAEVVTWVPARSSDVRRRGFDHARVLAREVAGPLGLPSARLLVRTDQRPDQAGLTAAERRGNLRGAFGGRPGKTRRVLLVDDLLTTGATAVECVSVLRACGAEEAEVLVACRA